MTGTIDAVSFKKEFTAKNGAFTRYYHNITIDGEKGETYTSEKSPSWLTVGTQVSFEKTSDNRGNAVFSKLKPASGASERTMPEYKKDDVQKLIVRQNCIGNAVNLVASMPSTSRNVNQVLEIAQQFEQYIFNND